MNRKLKWKIIDNPVSSDPDAPPLVLVDDGEVIVEHGDHPTRLANFAFASGADEVEHAYSYSAHCLREAAHD